jgi:hypothetical protein
MRKKVQNDRKATTLPFQRVFLFFLLLVVQLNPLHPIEAANPEGSLIEFCALEKKRSALITWYCKETALAIPPNKIRTPKLVKKGDVSKEETDDSLEVESKDNPNVESSFGVWDQPRRHQESSEIGTSEKVIPENEKVRFSDSIEQPLAGNQMSMPTLAVEEREDSEEALWDNGWQAQVGKLDAWYKERGYEIKLAGDAYGLRYQKRTPDGWLFGVGQIFQTGEGNADIGNVSGRMRWESLGFAAHGGFESSKTRRWRFHLTGLAGWREDIISYRHQQSSGAVRFSEPFRQGATWWGFEAGSSLNIWDDWLLGTAWQHIATPIRISYGDGTEAELSRSPLWLFWVEYR